MHLDEINVRDQSRQRYTPCVLDYPEGVAILAPPPPVRIWRSSAFFSQVSYANILKPESMNQFSFPASASAASGVVKLIIELSIILCSSNSVPNFRLDKSE